MKIEQLVVQYLYKHKQVSIQDIGQFSIGTNVIIPTEGDKDYSLPEGAIHFEFDKNAPADEGLIDFIKEQSGKIRSLAASDLESYSILTRQFLNIGKPLYIEALANHYILRVWAHFKKRNTVLSILPREHISAL